MLPNPLKRGRAGLLAPAPLLATVGVVVATLSVAGTPSQVAVPFLGVLGLLATLAIGRLQPDREAGAYLLEIMLLAVGVRFLLFALVQQSVGPYVFAPDQISYEQLGDQLVRSWGGLGQTPRSLVGSLQVAYPILNGALFLVFGPARAAPAVVNVFLATWIAIPVYYMTLLIVRENRAVARWATGLAVFFPSLLLWSVLNVREAPTILTVTLCVFFFVRFQKRVGVWDVAGAVATLAITALFREYLTVLVGLSAGAGILMGRSRSPVRSLAVGGVILLTLIFAAQQAGLGGSLTQEPSLQLVQVLRQDLAFGAGSAYGQGADVSTVSGALFFLPVGLAYFLLAPFPWAIGSALQAVTLPESLLWYALIPFGLRGLYLALRYDPRAYTVPASVFLVVTFAYAMVEGNVGTAYRHRAQVLPLAFIFCAVGLRDAYAVWAHRRAQRRERRQRTARSVTPIPERRRPPHPERG